MATVLVLRESSFSPCHIDGWLPCSVCSVTLAMQLSPTPHCPFKWAISTPRSIFYRVWTGIYNPVCAPRFGNIAFMRFAMIHLDRNIHYHYYWNLFPTLDSKHQKVHGRWTILKSMLFNTLGGIAYSLMPSSFHKSKNDCCAAQMCTFLYLYLTTIIGNRVSYWAHTFCFQMYNICNTFVTNPLLGFHHQLGFPSSLALSVAIWIARAIVERIRPSS